VDRRADWTGETSNNGFEPVTEARAYHQGGENLGGGSCWPEKGGRAPLILSRGREGGGDTVVIDVGEPPDFSMSERGGDDGDQDPGKTTEIFV